MLILEEHSEVFRRHNEIGLAAKSMDGVKGQGTGRQNQSVPERAGNGNRAGALRYLPLVIADNTKLQQLGHVFAQWQYLPEAPFVGEGLSGCFKRTVGALSRPVDLPIGEDVCAGAFVFGQVNRGAHDHVITEITGARIV